MKMFFNKKALCFLSLIAVSGMAHGVESAMGEQDYENVGPFMKQYVGTPIAQGAESVGNFFAGIPVVRKVRESLPSMPSLAGARDWFSRQQQRGIPGLNEQKSQELLNAQRMPGIMGSGLEEKTPVVVQTPTGQQIIEVVSPAESNQGGTIAPAQTSPVQQVAAGWNWPTMPTKADFYNAGSTISKYYGMPVSYARNYLPTLPSLMQSAWFNSLDPQTQNAIITSVLLGTAATGVGIYRNWNKIRRAPQAIRNWFVTPSAE